MDTVICNKQSLMPKLRRNRRLKSRWGIKYYAAVRNAIFLTQAPPYVPPEPPPSLKEYISEYQTLYECPQCKDCFHFRSSLEDHNARKSWVLGYWCQQCFTTICTHNPPEDTTCSACVQINRDKRSYLRSRGLHKNQKIGAIRIFYNQCQFFAHLKTHNVSMVDMGDVMLMPLPTNLDHKWGPEIDIAYEALMEHAFMTKVHIMDWLKEKNIENNWWQLVSGPMEDNCNPLSFILKGYKGRFYFKPLEIPIEEQLTILSSPHPASKKEIMKTDGETIHSLEKIDTRKSSSSVDTGISDESVIENEDNPCTVNDIAFVDCGSASKLFEPEIPINNFTNKRATMSVISSRDFSAIPHPANLVNKPKKLKAVHLNCISSDMVMSYGNTVITPKHDIDKPSWKNTMQMFNKSAMPTMVVNESNIVNVDSNANIGQVIPESSLSVEPAFKVQSNTSATKTNVNKDKVDKSKQNVHTLTVNSGQKIVTLQSTKHVDINTLINQLPPHIINSKKIVFIGKDSDNVAPRIKQELPPKKLIQLVPDSSHGKGVKDVQTKVVPMNTISESANNDSNKNILKYQSEIPKSKSRPCMSKVLYQNGRKYIIKQTPETTQHVKNASQITKEKTGYLKSTNGIPPLIPLNPPNLDNIQIQERLNSLHGDVSPLTPSPSPSELSSSSSCDVQSKQYSSNIKGAQRIDPLPFIVEPIENNLNANETEETSESLSFHKGADENLYLDIKFLIKKRDCPIIDTANMITRCKQEMLNELFHLSYSDLKKRYDHLQQIGDEIIKAMSFVGDNAIKENLKAVTILQHVLKHCIDKCSEGISNMNDEDTPLCEWETEYESNPEKLVCMTCGKIMKPKSFIPGFSKPAKIEIYCTCYRHVCHKCDMYQADSTRFVAHQMLHNREKPFLCPDCFRQFNTFKSLETHIWATCFHMLKKRILGCKICEINGFQDMESVARHFAIMHGHNKIACDKCYILLPSYTEYKKHCNEHHSNSDDQRPIRLVLCKPGRCIVRCEEFMLHMAKHSVVQRWNLFKCPFCDFIDAKAKRTMMHLQSEHQLRLKEIISSDVLSKVSTDLKTAQKKFTNAYEEPCEDGTIVPKIVNARTITSEVFERGAQDADDCVASFDVPESHKADNTSKTVPKILEVRSIADATISRLSNANKTYRNVKKTNAVVHRETGIKVDTRKTVALEENAGEPNSGTKAVDSETMKAEKSNHEAIQGDSLSKAAEETNTGGQSASGNTEEKLSCEEEKIKIKTEGTDTKETENAPKGTQTENQDEHPPRVLISTPPPLARIPQHILQSTPSKKPDQPTKEKKERSSPRTLKANSRQPKKIALNGPLNSPQAAINFSCHLCGELINTSQSVINSHYHFQHSQECKLSVLTLPLLRMSQEFIDGGYKDLLGNRKRKSENGASNSKRRRRWTPKKYNESKNSNFAGLGLCVQQETAKDSEGNFRCKKCDQRCTDMINLREHIATNHRIKGRYLICLECGENFVVAPSLQMHLKAFHGIEDPITYMAQNTLYAPDSVDDLELEGKAIEANQCHVCMAVFEDKAAVDKHLRVHGMAFLNRKRIEAQNALRSPEKKNEQKEEKSSVKSSPKESVRKDKPAETILEKISATI